VVTGGRWGHLINMHFYASILGTLQNYCVQVDFKTGKEAREHLRNFAPDASKWHVTYLDIQPQPTKIPVFYVDTGMYLSHYISLASSGHQTTNCLLPLQVHGVLSSPAASHVVLGLF